MRLKFKQSLLLAVCALTFAVPSSSNASNENDSGFYLNGGGTEDNPYLIGSVEELNSLRRYIETCENASKDKFYKLTNDIRINDRVTDATGNIVSDVSKLSEWIPIGSGETLSPYHAFQGNFDGDGHTIYGIYIDDTDSENSLGLFGCVHKGGTVKNLRIADSYIRGKKTAGGICGFCYGGLIADCESNATVISTGPTLQVGGIVGELGDSNGRLLRCTNKGNVTGCSVPDEYGQQWNCYIGGICGSVGSSVIDSCYNEGVVKADGWGAVGGVTGSVSGGARVRYSCNKGYVSSNTKANIGGIAGNNWSNVTGCVNEGEIVAFVEGSCIGGICGINSFNSYIYDSENNSDIICSVDSVYVGGIVGNMDGGRSNNTYYTPRVYRCKNNGTIQTTGPKSMSGGISGKNYCSEIYDSQNNGHVISALYAGGISPLCEYHSNISGCSNTGHVEGASSTGGIVGETNGSVTGSWNSGHVTNCGKLSTAGGIAGYTSSVVSDCFNTGEVYDAANAGGIVGNGNQKGSVIRCYNAGYIHTSNTRTIVAGLCAGSCSITNSYNVGTIQADADNCTLGGLAYNVWVSWDSHGNRSGCTVTNSYNMGRLLVKGRDCRVGNIVGYYEEYNVSYLLKNCYYLADAVEGEDYLTFDTQNDYQKPLDADGFKTLAQDINVKEYLWDETPDAFSQGYYRPVLNGDSDSDTLMHYTVSTLHGESVLVDLGEPADNTFFTVAEPTDMMLDIYNFLYDNTARRVMIVDEKDFEINEGFTAQNLTYTRKLSDGWFPACLPFGVDAGDLPDGCRLLSPLEIKNDGNVLCSDVEAVGAGCPFLLLVNGGVAELAINKQNVAVIAKPATASPLCGTFKAFSEWMPGCYINANGAEVFSPVQQEDVLLAFRAYIMAGGNAVEKLTLVDKDDPHTAVKNVSASASVMSGNRCIYVYSPSATGIRVYNASGKQVYCNEAPEAYTTIPVNMGGIFIVNVNGESTKTFVE